ncbi:replication protein P [Marinomonas sp. C2222]|uniref:Replication protein P n=1 Tax=Marinomonas sargassi TaxID=2984494 RepID=A0ABT2YN45_9GAMM|nr:replication protein P [Marinomonas sargassi]MCV2401292.1 replication protein P [Marinomonas sargassi]
MKEPQAVQNLIKPLENKLATHSQTSTTQTGDYANSAYQGKSAGQESGPTEAEQQTRVLVNMIFARFKAIYTHKFASAYSTLEEVKLAKREWAVALKGFQEPLLAYAVERTKEEYAWPPTISEFLKLISTAYKAYGLANPRAAYLEACACRTDPLSYKWSHPAVFFAGSETDWYKLKSEEERVSWPLFEQNYLAIVDRVIAGERLVIPKVVMIENKQTVNLNNLTSKIAKALSLEEDDIAPLLYYTQKTQGTGVRTRYREIAQKKLMEMGYKETLPE